MFQLASPGQRNTKTPCFEVAPMSFQATTEALPWACVLPVWAHPHTNGAVWTLSLCIPLAITFLLLPSRAPSNTQAVSTSAQVTEQEVRESDSNRRNQENACLLCVQENGAASNAGFAEQSIRTPHANASLGRTWERALDAWRERASKTSPVLCWWSIWRRFRMLCFFCFFCQWHCVCTCWLTTGAPTG